MKNCLFSENSEEFERFYNSRYSQGYMDDYWDSRKRQRVFRLVRGLNLPKVGCALDFGCGTGIWTNLLKSSLPGWDVFGVDISSKAISIAKKKYPNLNFFSLTNEQNFYQKFDFLFSHHVLEHVLEMEKTFDTISKLLKTSASMLHILPCGNCDSLEHRIASNVKNGINKNNGRFFLEEPAHLRRLNTRQMNVFAKKIGFNLYNAYYAGHYWGSLKGVIAKFPKQTLSFLSPDLAQDEKAKNELKKFRGKFFPISVLRFPSVVFEARKPWLFVSYKNLFENLLLAALYPFSFPMNFYVKFRAEKEWESCRNQENGSEMYLFYKRNL